MGEGGPAGRFGFAPCADRVRDPAEGCEQDCFHDPHPPCGDCLWARGVVHNA